MCNCWTPLIIIIVVFLISAEIKAARGAQSTQTLTQATFAMLCDIHVSHINFIFPIIDLRHGYDPLLHPRQRIKVILIVV